MRLCIFEDRANLLEPLSLTRPVFDLRCGITTLADKQRRAAGVNEWGALMRIPLAELYRRQRPDVAANDADWLAGDDVILVNGRWLPPDDFAPPDSSCVGMVGDAIAFVAVKKRQATGFTLDELPEWLRHSLDTSPPYAAGGRMICYPWDLVDQNADEIRRDFGWLSPSARTDAPALLGPLDNLWIAPSAQIEPMVVADTRHGPVVIDEDAVVSAFSRLEGPCYIGPKTQVHGAKIRAGTSLGPQCRVGGEVEASIIHGYSNKYHDGFLGHSYVGEWVNLGAGTHNSDLRNDYGEVTVNMHGAPVPTGMSKVGCFLGDHTKTGLGTLLNTGTNVGAFCNLLPAGRFAPKYVPSFTSWWNGSLREVFTLEQLLATAEIAMKRRGVVLTEAHKAFYAWLLDDTLADRRRTLRESEQRQLRKSA
jgi:UDP-N-acetylglucosamine diphosphorylase / glucose-1-phosphate thymidylyltransferase / UDP-N-acetylgalactosamine diphosphorylase / glucosamine-1-phosphate N-acetyltransferase / galactosamine-1-phosphate N-acetyltransferase